MNYKLANGQDAYGFSGRDLRGWRESAGLSRRALAERANCSQSTIVNLERGDLPVHSFVLPRVLAALSEAAAGGEGGRTR